ncbi:MAG: YafY family protein [Parvularculaceae bacterium]
MRASRLLSILLLLQLRGRISAEELSREFEVSVRTIYRDVDQLSAAGAPIYAERGRNGGFALDGGFRTKLTGLTAREAEALLFSGAGSPAADLGVDAELTAAQLKVLASLPPDQGASAEKIAARFHLDPVAWYRRAEKLHSLPAIAAAVWREKRLSIRYESWKGSVARVIDPLGLVLKGGLWYLVAAVEGAPRTYRVSNILEIEILETPARRPRKFDLRRYWVKWALEFEERLLSERARVRLSPLGLKILRDESPAAASVVDHEPRESNAGGWITVEIPFENTREGVRRLLSLGAEMEILHPAQLRMAAAKAADDVARLYRGRKTGARRL